MIESTKSAILLASFNGESYIKEQLDSLFSQSDQNWHLFVHDDGSKDNTLSICRSYQQKHADQMTIIDAPSTGSSKDNFFYLMSQVEAPYYFYSDQDDVWMKDKIKKTAERMQQIEQKDKPSLVFTDLRIVDEQLNVIAEKMEDYQQLNYTDLSFRQLMVQAAVTGCTMMINRELRDLMLKTSDHSNIIMHDWWASLIASYFGAISCFNEPTINYRQHHDNSVGAKNFDAAHSLKRLLNQKDDMRKAVNLTMQQAAEFARVFHLPADTDAFIYGSLLHEGSTRRRYTCLKRGYHKTPETRNLGYYLVGL